jgi:hypothetical protein
MRASSICGVSRLLLTLLTLLLALAALQGSLVAAESIDDVVGPLVRDLEELRRSRVDVSGLVASLDEATRLWESGDVEGALVVLNATKAEVEALKAEAPRVYVLYIARVALTVLILLLAPPAFYTLFPRLYLRLWLSYRRGWVVVKGASRR